LDEPDEDGAVLLKYPPALLLFRLDVTTEHFPRLLEGVIPISPFEDTFSVIVIDGQKHRICCRQLAVTPAYAFTDFKARGQTLTPFNALRHHEAEAGILFVF
jgi:hypothetical protein